jgi:hypothetical protein
MTQNEYWKRFESTGQIDDYLHYKQSGETVQSAQDAQETEHANNNDGAGAARHKNR